MAGDVIKPLLDQGQGREKCPCVCALVSVSLAWTDARENAHVYVRVVTARTRSINTAETLHELAAVTHVDDVESIRTHSSGG